MQEPRSGFVDEYDDAAAVDGDGYSVTVGDEKVTLTANLKDNVRLLYVDNQGDEKAIPTAGTPIIDLADSYTIFFNDDGDAETWTASKLEREYDDVAFAGYISVFENDDDQAVEIYVTPDTDASEEEPGEEDTYTVDFDITGVDADAAKSETPEYIEYVVRIPKLEQLKLPLSSEDEAV